MSNPPGLYNVDIKPPANADTEYAVALASDSEDAEDKIYAQYAKYAVGSAAKVKIDTPDKFNEEFAIRLMMYDQVPAPPPKNKEEFAKLSDEKKELYKFRSEVARARWGLAMNYATRVPTTKPGLATLHRGDDPNNPSKTDYGMEAMDPQHRLGDMRAFFRLHFQRKFPAFGHKIYYFFMWMHEMSVQFPAAVKTMAKQFMPNLPEETYDSYVGYGVKYLDFKYNKSDDTATLQRKMYGRFSHLLCFVGGLMYQRGRLFDTSTTRTHFSGQGWAIYVVSPSGVWYAGSHIVGKFQHSSFLGGRPVMSAGEMQVERGVPKLISAKSGHYQPNMQQFYNGLKILSQSGVNLDSLRVKAFSQSLRFGKTPTLISAKEFLSNAALRSTLSIW